MRHPFGQRFVVLEFVAVVLRAVAELRLFGPADGAGVGREIASHWRGATYRIYEEKSSKAPLLLHASEWDSTTSARSFFQAYAEVLKNKSKQIEIQSETEDQLIGHGDTGDFSLRISGALVQAVEGVPSPEIGRAHV